MRWPGDSFGEGVIALEKLEIEAKIEALMALEDLEERETQINNVVVENIHQVHYQVKPNDSDLCAIFFDGLKATFGDETSRFIECVAVELVRSHLAYSIAFKQSVHGALDDLDLRKLINDCDDGDGYFFNWLLDYEFLYRSPLIEFGLDMPHMDGVQLDAAAYILFDVASYSDGPKRRSLIKDALNLLSFGAFKAGEMHKARSRAFSDEAPITPSLLRSEFARLGARAKLKDDPKQIAKAKVKQEFEAWQRNEVRYKNNSEFAAAMMKHGLAFKTIEGWLPIWRKVTP